MHKPPTLDATPCPDDRSWGTRGVAPLVSGVVALALASSGCGHTGGVKLRTSAPIEVSGGMYKQNGKPLDGRDMLKKLERHPAASDELHGYRALSTGGMVLAAVGGGLIGWPLGQAATDVDPNWELAAIGGGLALVALILGVVADHKVSNAVETYNAGFDARRSLGDPAIAPAPVVPLARRTPTELLVSDEIDARGMQVRWLGRPATGSDRVAVRFVHEQPNAQLEACSVAQVHIDDEVAEYPLKHQRHNRMRRTPAMSQLLANIAVAKQMQTAEVVTFDLCGAKRTLTPSEVLALTHFVARFDHGRHAQKQETSPDTKPPREPQEVAKPVSREPLTQHAASGAQMPSAEVTVAEAAADDTRVDEETVEEKAADEKAVDETSAKGAEDR